MQHSIQVDFDFESKLQAKIILLNKNNNIKDVIRVKPYEATIIHKTI